MIPGAQHVIVTKLVHPWCTLKYTYSLGSHDTLRHCQRARACCFSGRAFVSCNAEMQKYLAKAGSAKKKHIFHRRPVERRGVLRCATGALHAGSRPPFRSKSYLPGRPKTTCSIRVSLCPEGTVKMHEKCSGIGVRLIFCIWFVGGQ